MSTKQPGAFLIPTQLPHVYLAEMSVDLDPVAGELRAFVGDVAQVYFYLFGRSLVVTSGKDGKHTGGSKHYTGKAIDVRSHDLDPGEQVIFLAILAYMSPEKGIGVFDERGLSSGPHWHIELLN
jgi:hypothetical protein